MKGDVVLESDAHVHILTPSSLPVDVAEPNLRMEGVHSRHLIDSVSDIGLALESFHTFRAHDTKRCTTNISARCLAQ